MTLLDRIKKVSKKRGYSLTKVNNMANLGTNTIYSWKTKEPSYNNLKAVADVLGVSTDYLLGKTQTQKNYSEDKEFGEMQAGLFRKATENENFTSEEKDELKDDVSEYLKLRAKILRERKTKKDDQ